VKVVITAAAKRDLIGIADYIRPHNPGRAASFVEELLDHCQTLAELSLRHPLVPRFERHGVRRCVHADYLIFYRVRMDFVQVIHSLHGARDYEALLFPNH
jgi:addiction module RelE/StbE family toxin